MTNPRLVFLAGPDGAGKTTFFETFLQDCGLDFVNADRFTAAMGIPNAEAVKVADAVRQQLLAEGRSFITETVFSDPVGAKIQLLRDAIANGYHVTLLYIGIASPQLSEARISQRVGGGGHDVPVERLERRFRQSLKNLSEALAFVPEAHVFDNGYARMPFRLVLTSRNGRIEFRSEPLPDWLAGILSE